MDQVHQALSDAERLIEAGRAPEAVSLLEPLLGAYPRVADLHYCYGYACARAGDPWAGLDGYERARQLSRDPALWLPLAWLYWDLDLHVHALEAFRRALKWPLDASELDAVSAVVAELEAHVHDLAADLGLPASQVERGLHFMEAGGRALQESDFAASIAASRQAIRLLGDWPPPHNNLSLALFFDGRPQEAITTARQVLARDGTNLQALANAIRFLAWTGQAGEARELWRQLEILEPEDVDDRLKMAEAAAMMDQDEAVYRLLKPLDRAGGTGMSPIVAGQRLRYFLAVAEANLGKRTARRRFRELEARMPGVRAYLEALAEGRPGPGWADRFPYFHIHELLPRRSMEEFIKLVGREDHMPEKRFRSQVARFAERFPQVVLVAEKLLWEEKQPDVAIHMLETIATPAAYAALRRFGLSQAGGDDMRMEAMHSLLGAGEISSDETLRFWHRGQWQEIQMRQYEVTGEHIWEYAPEVVELLNRGTLALEEGDLEQAEPLFRRVLELDPTVKEAYNNLGALYGRQGETARAMEMCEAALEIDPLYVHPRCNLALYLLDSDDLEGAVDMLRPLADLTQFHAQELAFFSYVQARLALAEEEYDQARQALEAALEVWPGYELAEDLLARLELISRFKTGFGTYFERQRARDEAKRTRLQAALSTADPSLHDALSLYTKEVLTGMGRVVLPLGGWSTLKKAELLDEILRGLGDPENLEWIVGQLNDGEREALGQVLAQGGHMPWQDFDARYGNDLEESRYWQWHVPETTMGRLRHRGLLTEATVKGELLVAVPLELRPVLAQLLDR